MLKKRSSKGLARGQKEEKDIALPWGAFQAFYEENEEAPKSVVTETARRVFSQTFQQASAYAYTQALTFEDYFTLCYKEALKETLEFFHHCYQAEARGKAKGKKED